MADPEEDVAAEEPEESEGDKKAAQAALHFTIGRIAEEEFPDGQISRLSVAALTELTMGYMETFAHDLENFAGHAGRRKINVEDVKLMARRNPSVMTAISKVIAELAAETEQKKEQKKRKAEAAGKSGTKSKKQAEKEKAEKDKGEDEIVVEDEDV